MERGALLRRIGVVLAVSVPLALGFGPAAGGGPLVRHAPARGAAFPSVALERDGAMLGAILRDLRAPDASAEERAPRPEPALLVRIPRAMRITAHPGGGRAVGTMPAGSKYYHEPITAWVIDVARRGRFGEVTVPYSGSGRTGWIPIRGLRRDATWVTVRVDLSRHLLVVEKRDRVLGRFTAATGAPGSPTPPGRYFVTDRVAFPAGSYYGTFAFGISGIQTRLPPGWSGGNQLAIHGTNSPSSIGRSVSAGCLRVSEAALDRLKPLLQPGTPVIVRP